MLVGLRQAQTDISAVMLNLSKHLTLISTLTSTYLIFAFMNYSLLIFGLGFVCFGVYILYDDYRRWGEMKQKNREKLYKSVLFGALLIIAGIIAVVRGFTGQPLHWE